MANHYTIQGLRVLDGDNAEWENVLIDEAYYSLPDAESAAKSWAHEPHEFTAVRVCREGAPVSEYDREGGFWEGIGDHD